MITCYCKATFRYLWKNKFYSAINIIGLAFGLVCAFLIYFWVQDELSFDNFHTNLDTL